jgi:hypothetical protein
LSQIIYFGLLKFFPEIVSDQKGIALILSNDVLKAQSEYHDKHGVYAANLQVLPNFSARGERFRVGYANDFTKELRTRCNDCVYTGQSYKVMIVIKWFKGVTCWSLDNTGKLNQIVSIPFLATEFRKL